MAITDPQYRKLPIGSMFQEPGTSQPYITTGIDPNTGLATVQKISRQQAIQFDPSISMKGLPELGYSAIQASSIGYGPSPDISDPKWDIGIPQFDISVLGGIKPFLLGSTQAQPQPEPTPTTPVNVATGAQQTIQTTSGAQQVSVEAAKKLATMTGQPYTPPPAPTQAPSMVWNAPQPIGTPLPSGVFNPPAQQAPATGGTQGITKVPTGSIGPDGKPVYDLFQNGQHLTQYPTGVNIDDIPIGTAPSGFQSQFQPVQGQAPVSTQQAGAPTPTQEAQPAAGIGQPTAGDPNIANIQAVFGPQWQPSPAFTPELQGKGVYGAVRIEGHDEVYTIGPGGTWETPDSFQEKFGTLAQEGIVGEVTVDQARRLGILVKDDGTPTNVTKEDIQKTPYQSFLDLYKELYVDSGLQSIKDQMDTLNKDLKALDAKYADDMAKVNENPWLSESLRQRKIDALNDKYEMQKGQITNQVALFQGFYDSGKQDIQWVAGQYLQQINADREFDLNYLKYLADTAEVALPETTTDIKEYNLAVSQGYEGSFIDFQRDIATARRAPRVGGGGGGGSVGRPPTQAQFDLANYATRMQQSSAVIDSLEGYIAGLSGLEFNFQKNAPYSLKSEKFKNYEQASRNFINAVLRRESGAAIAESEFENARSQYLPRGGDPLSTLKLKKDNRNQVFSNFSIGAGPAFEQLQEVSGITTQATGTLQPSSLTTKPTAPELDDLIIQAKRAGDSLETIAQDITIFGFSIDKARNMVRNYFQ